MHRFLSLGALTAPAVALVALVPLFAAACGSSSSDPSNAPGADAGPATNPDTGPSPDSSTPVGDSGGADTAVPGSFVEAPHLAFPQLQYGGGPLMTAPKVVTVTFKTGETMTSDLEAFGKTVTSSSWWDAVRAGYCGAGGTSCIGDGPAGVSVELPGAAAGSYTDSAQGGASTLQTFILDELNGDAGLPAPDPNTMYVFYMPANTSVSLDGTPSCANGGFDGYHNQLTFGAQQVPYAIVDECSPQQGITELQMTTITASHEIIETATDGISTQTTGGYYLDLTDMNTWGWDDIGGGEAGDMCVDFFGNTDEAPEGTYTAQRIWSNPAAASGHDPCVPARTSNPTYFNVAPAKAFFIVDTGKSVTFEADAFSDAPRADWTFSLMDITDPSTTYLTFTIADSTGKALSATPTVNNGTKLQVTMTLAADPVATVANGGTGDADALLVASEGDPNTATVFHFWPIAVVSTEEAADAGITAAVRRPELSGPHRRAPGALVDRMRHPRAPRAL